MLRYELWEKYGEEQVGLIEQAVRKELRRLGDIAANR